MAQTAKLGVNDALLGASLVPGLGASEAPPLTADASNTLSLSQTADVELHHLASSTLTLSHLLEVTYVRSVSAESTVSLTQNDGVARPYNLTASSAISPTEEGVSSQKTPSASGTLTLQSSARLAEVHELFASSQVSLAHEAKTTLKTPFAESAIAITGQAFPGAAFGSALQGDANGTLLLSQEANAAKTLASATDVQASSTLTLTQIGRQPIEVTATNAVAFSQGTDDSIIKFCANALSLSHTATTNVVRLLTSSQVLSVYHAVQFETQDVPTKHYAPRVGATSDPDAPSVDPNAPTLTPANDVHFAYPTSGPYTYELTLRTPQFGDRDRLIFSRINRELRGGTLKVFSDATWPEEQQLLMQFTGIKPDEKSAILTFLKNTVGREIRFRDWEGRVWHGFVINPDTAVIQNRRNAIDVSIEFEGEVQ